MNRFLEREIAQCEHRLVYEGNRLHSISEVEKHWSSLLYKSVDIPPNWAKLVILVRNFVVIKTTLVFRCRYMHSHTLRKSEHHCPILAYALVFTRKGEIWVLTEKTRVVLNPLFFPNTFSRGTKLNLKQKDSQPF